MAIYNEILAPRYARMLQKLFGIKGSVPAKQLAGEIAPSLPLFNGRENRYLEGWSTFAAKNNAAAVAAQDSVIRFRNPAGSNTVAVIESLIIWMGTGEFVLEFSNVDSGALLTVPTPANFDNRLLPPGTGSNGAQCSISQNNNVGQGTHVVFADFQPPASAVAAVAQMPELINFESQEITLLPNSDLQLRTITLNVGASMNVRWRERFLEESERQ